MPVVAIASTDKLLAFAETRAGSLSQRAPGQKHRHRTRHSTLTNLRDVDGSRSADVSTVARGLAQRADTCQLNDQEAQFPTSKTS